MNKQFTFTSSGVQEWLAYIYEGGDQRIEDECTTIALHFVNWISYRFNLSSMQIEFLNTLGEIAQDAYSADIRDTLLHHGHISLDKEEESKYNRESQNLQAQNPKVVWKEKQNAIEQEATTRKGMSQNITAQLKFRITYPKKIQ